MITLVCYLREEKKSKQSQKSSSTLSTLLTPSGLSLPECTRTGGIWWFIERGKKATEICPSAAKLAGFAPPGRGLGSGRRLPGSPGGLWGVGGRGARGAGARGGGKWEGRQEGRKVRPPPPGLAAPGSDDASRRSHIPPKMEARPRQITSVD